MKKLNLFINNLLVIVVINSSQIAGQTFFSYPDDYDNSARVDSVIVESGWKLLQIEESMQGSMYPNAVLKSANILQGSTVMGKVTPDKKKFKIEAKYLVLNRQNWVMVPFTGGPVTIKGTATDPPAPILYSSAFLEKREAARKAMLEEQKKLEEKRKADEAAAQKAAEETKAKELALAKAKEDSMLAAKALEEKSRKGKRGKKGKKSKAKVESIPIDQEILSEFSEPSPKKEEASEEGDKPSAPKEVSKPPAAAPQSQWNAKVPTAYISAYYLPGARHIADPDSFFRVKSQYYTRAGVSWLTSGPDQWIGSLSGETYDWDEDITLRIGRRFQKVWKFAAIEANLGGVFEEGPFTYLDKIDTTIAFVDSIRNLYVSGDSVRLLSTLVSGVGAFLSIGVRGPLQSYASIDMAKTNYSSTYSWKLSVEPTIPIPVTGVAKLHLFYQMSGSSSRFDRREFRAYRRLQSRRDGSEWTAGIRFYGITVGGGKQNSMQFGWRPWAPFWKQTETGLHALTEYELSDSFNWTGRIAKYLIRPFRIGYQYSWDHYDRADVRSNGSHDSSNETGVWTFHWSWNW